MSYAKLTPLPGQINGCLNCGYKASKLEMSHKCYDYGFDFEFITRNGKTVFSTINLPEKDNCTMQKWENMARNDPDADWRFHYLGGLSETEYQRQGKNLWVLVRIGQGMA